MSIEVTCKSCQATFNVAAERAGQRSRCPQCRSPVHVPEEQRSLLPQSASQLRARRPRSGSQPALAKPRSGSQPSLAKQRSGSQPALARPRSGSQPSLAKQRSGSQPSLAKRRSGTIHTEESRPVWPALAVVFACSVLASLVILLLHELGG